MKLVVIGILWVVVGAVFRYTCYSEESLGPKWLKKLVTIPVIGWVLFPFYWLGLWSMYIVLGLLPRRG